jgi:chromosome segregation ATPase
MILNRVYFELFCWYSDAPEWYNGGLSARFREKSIIEGIQFFQDIKLDTYEYLKGDLQELYSSNSIQDGDVDHIKDYILRRSISTLRDAIKAERQVSSDLKKQIEVIAEKSSAQDEELSNLQNEVDKLNKEINQRKKIITNLSEKNASLKKRILRLHYDLKSQKSKYINVKENYKAYKNYPGSLKRHIKLYILKKIGRLKV